MASKPKATAATKKSRNSVVVLSQKDENPDDATARTLTRPEVQAAATIQKWEGGNHEVNALARELTAQVVAVNGGDLLRAEGMLIAQAHTLDALFNNLARRAHGQEYLHQYETYMRLALKTQSQCRATLETLAAIKNPPSVAFVRQANIASGPQQVNNGIPASSRAREIESAQSKLLEAHYGERLDTGTEGAAIGADPQLATVGKIDRTKDGTGKG